MNDKTLLEFKKSDVFTPGKISKLMASFLKKNGTLLEPAVGDGQLLKFIKFNDYETIDIYDIKDEYLVKCPNNNNINKFKKDFLLTTIDKKYTNIILNPPYIKIQDMSSEYCKFIKDKWEILNKGNIDIYYAFIIKCLELLEDDGIMIAITPNSYLYNKSSLYLRKYLIENKLIEKIIDFKSEKVFDKVSTYCCITIFNKLPKDKLIYNDKEIYYNNISTSGYSIFISNNKNNKTIGDICNIKNGIATLRDKIYIHDNKLFEEPCWKIINTSNKEHWIIFPYNECGKLIEEDVFTKSNPKTYEYLLNNKEELSKRDKGNKTYPIWYAFGRTQSLILSGQKNVIYVSTFVDPNNIQYKIDKPKLCIGCLCIELKDNKYKLEDLKKIFEKNKDFIINNSSKRGGGWLNISGSILKQIPI